MSLPKLVKSLSISPLFKIIYGLINRSALPVKYLPILPYSMAGIDNFAGLKSMHKDQSIILGLKAFLFMFILGPSSFRAIRMRSLPLILT